MTPVEFCSHPQATHLHGTYVAYVTDRCRCELCRTANREQARQRRLQGANRVPAARAAAHLRSLMDQGMGLNRIRRVAGLGSNVGRLVYDHADRPGERITRETEARILAIELDVADGAKVCADEAREIVEELLARGWTRRGIARRLNGTDWFQRVQSPTVLAGTLRRLRWLLFEPAPARLHSRWGTPLRYVDRIPQLVHPTTAGVPDDPRLAALREEFAIRRDREGIAQALLATSDSSFVRQLAHMVRAQA